MKEKKICRRCKKKDAIEGIKLPVQEEKFWLCKDCLILVLEVFLKWMEVPKGERILWDYEKGLKK